MIERRVRMMEPRDLPACWRIARAQNRRDQTSYPFPPVFDLDPRSRKHGQTLPNIALALVTEARLESEGRSSGSLWRVRMGHVFLRTIEEMSFGGGREEMEFSAKHIPMAAEILRSRGYDDTHTFVPLPRADALEGLLAKYGLTRIETRLAHFFRML